MELKCGTCKITFSIDQRTYRAGFRRSPNRTLFFCSQDCSKSWQREQGKASRTCHHPSGMGKQCPKCKQVLTSETAFRKSDSRLSGYCRKCMYEYQYVRWNKLKVRAVEHLGGCCSRCGVKGHPVIFDFHHRESDEKEFDWGRLRRKSWDKILLELAKCELLCGACHRIHHVNPVLWSFLDE